MAAMDRGFLAALAVEGSTSLLGSARPLAEASETSLDAPERQRLMRRRFPDGFPSAALPLLRGDEDALLAAFEADPALCGVQLLSRLKTGGDQRSSLFELAGLAGMPRAAAWASERVLREAGARELLFLLPDPPEQCAWRPGYLSEAPPARPIPGQEADFWLSLRRFERSVASRRVFSAVLAERPELVADMGSFLALLERASWSQGAAEPRVWAARLAVDPGFAVFRAEKPAHALRVARGSLFRFARQKATLSAELIEALAGLGAQTQPRAIMLARRLPGQKPLAPELLKAYEASPPITPSELAALEGFPATCAALCAVCGFSAERARAAAPMTPPERISAGERAALAVASPLADCPEGAAEPASRRKPRL
jgi:hypothetical protein